MQSDPLAQQSPNTLAYLVLSRMQSTAFLQDRAIICEYRHIAFLSEPLEFNLTTLVHTKSSS
jgi:hypothetical protein